MKIVYAPQAIADLGKIGDYSRRTFGDSVAAALETYIRASIARIAILPESGKLLPQRAFRPDGIIRSIRNRAKLKCWSVFSSEKSAPFPEHAPASESAGHSVEPVSVQNFLYENRGKCRHTAH
jgi:plasmid stabilization system protein ParE